VTIPADGPQLELLPEGSSSVHLLRNGDACWCGRWCRGGRREADRAADSEVDEPALDRAFADEVRGAGLCRGGSASGSQPVAGSFARTVAATSVACRTRLEPDRQGVRPDVEAVGAVWVAGKPVQILAERASRSRSRLNSAASGPLIPASFGEDEVADRGALPGWTKWSIVISTSERWPLLSRQPTAWAEFLRPGPLGLAKTICSRSHER
jgi:hypothetical protein